MGLTLGEQETIVRWDRTDDAAIFWTADQFQAERWKKKGYLVTEEPGGWSARVDKKLVSFRRVRTENLPSTPHPGRFTHGYRPS